jgi:hypothetical protein
MAGRRCLRRFHCINDAKYEKQEQWPKIAFHLSVGGGVQISLGVKKMVFSFATLKGKGLPSILRTCGSLPIALTQVACCC